METPYIFREGKRQKAPNISVYYIENSSVHVFFFIKNLKYFHLLIKLNLIQITNFVNITIVPLISKKEGRCLAQLIAIIQELLEKSRDTRKV